jgi:signal transduction histidine kinase
MPSLATWTVITVKTSLALLLLIIFVALVAYASYLFLQTLLQVKTLTNRVEELNLEIESLQRQKPEVSSIQESYLQFIHNLFHEVSNPLQSVQTNLENMADCSPQEIGRWRQYYTIIRQEMKRLFTLTENLRLLSQLESITTPIRREPVNLKSVIEDVIMAQAERASEKNIKLNYQGPNRPAQALGNRDHLYEVIINLVDNSIKYANESSGNIMIVLGEEEETIQVMVKDDGIGIPEEDLPFIFDTAYRSSSKLTARRTGSGLGLAIVKRIVNQHEGKIRAESVNGEGTTIIVELPLYKPSYSE